MKVLANIKSWISNHIKDLIWSLIVVFLLFICTLLITRQYNQNKTQASNIIALTDSMSYWKTNSGKVIAEKTLLETDYNTIKQINDSLYKKLKEMDIKNPIVVIDGGGTIINEKHDTTWLVPDTIYKEKYVSRKFDFSNKWRTLNGIVYHEQDTLGLSIQKDIVNFDYTLAIEDNKVVMSSTNPYVSFNKVTGFVVPSTKQKQKKFGLGPIIYGGYNINSKSFGYGIGIGVQYNILSW